MLLDPPYSLRIQDRSPLTLVAVVRGSGWVQPDGGAPRPLHAGDVAVMRGPEPYLLADDPSRPPQVVVHPGQECATPSGESLHDALGLGLRSWGTNPDGAVAVLVGSYEECGAVGQRLLKALPPCLVLPGTAWDTPLVPLLADEIGKDEPGQEVVLDRLLDLLLIGVLRTWFARPEADAPRWFRARADPVVGRALRLLQNAPARQWTVGHLARETGVSRATLARRFTELVGEPPMTFLTEWRLALAADLLREPDATVASVARRVGYGSPFALSTAFERVRGVNPRDHATAGR